MLQKLLFLIFFFTISSSFSAELKAYLFASTSCEQCQELKVDFFPKVLKKYPQVSIEHIPVDGIEDFTLQMQFERLYETQSEESLKVFVGRSVLSGKDDVLRNFEEILQKELSAKNITPNIKEVKDGFVWKDSSIKKEAQTTIVDRFDALSLGVIAAAGLGDGVNPCAFVTLVFMISVLSQLKKSKREILQIGLTFSAAVFFTYLLIGLGILKFVNEFSVQSGISSWLNRLTALFCLGLAIWSFRDCLKMRYSDQNRSMSLKLPLFIRKIMNRLIRRQMSSKRLIWSALIAGVGISLLESICTGQVYLPIIVYVLKSSASATALGYLLLYNFMFIVPLLVVFFLAWQGMSSQRITQFFNKHLLLSKVLMTLLFLMLGIVLLIF